MLLNKFKPVKITDHLYKLGTDFFSVYLSVGEDAMLIEGGTGAATGIIFDQLDETGIDPKIIKYLVLSHSHGDHIGSVSHIRQKWDHIKLATSPAAFNMLTNQKVIDDFVLLDDFISEKMIALGEIAEKQQRISNNFHVDLFLEEGARIDLGAGIKWNVYNVPGHSSCQIALFEEKEGIIATGDSTGLYNRAEDTFWPNYFESLEQYCNSIRILASLPAKGIALSHFGFIDKGADIFCKRTLKATEAYHFEMLKRVESGETIEEIGRDKANWINSFVDHMPYFVMENMSKLLVKRSLKEAGKDNLFSDIYSYSH